MIIIVEGIDRVGKTTLCKKLSDELGFPIFKNVPYLDGVRTSQCENELINQLINFMECTKPNVILDRFHASEFVYGKLERNYKNYDVFVFDERLSKLDCILLYVRPTDVKCSSDEHGKDLTKHLLAFDNFMVSTRIESFVCDYNTLDDAVTFAKRKYLGV